MPSSEERRQAALETIVTAREWIADDHRNSEQIENALRTIDSMVTESLSRAQVAQFWQDKLALLARYAEDIR